MAGPRDTIRARRPIIPGDWIAPSQKGLQIGQRLRKVECELILETAGIGYSESWQGRVRSVSMSRSELETAQVGLMPDGVHLRIMAEGRDLRLRLPSPLGLRLLAWLGHQPPYDWGSGPR